MDQTSVRTGSSEAPASVRRGVIRRRLRWVVRVGAVLGLALVLAVAGTIRDNQRAHAFLPLLAPLAPVIVGSAAPTAGAIAAGAGVMLGGIFLSEQMRKDGQDGSLDWFNDMFKTDAIGQGLKDWFNNEDQDTAPDTSDRTPVPEGQKLVNGRDWDLTNWREHLSSAGNTQLSIDLSYDQPLPWGGSEYFYAAFDYQCRTSDGKIVRQMGQKLFATAYIVNSGNGTGLFPKTTLGLTCAESLAPVSVALNPMTEQNWADVDATRTNPTSARETTLDEGAFWIFKDSYKGSTGTKTTLECTQPDGSTLEVVTDNGDAAEMDLQPCPGGAELTGAKVERTMPDGTVHPVPVAEGSYAAPRPVAVAVDGQECVQAATGCANWTEVAQTSPERVQCLSGGVAVHVSNCNTLERFYENGGTVVHPFNIDGDPNTYYDPWSDPEFTPVVQQADGTYAPAPYRPTERPPVESPEPWEPDPNWDPNTDPNSPLEPTQEPDPEPTYTDPYKDPASPLYDPYQDPNNPKYDPYADPDSPLFDPDYDPSKHDPDSPNYEPSPEPSSPAEPSPEPTAPAEPEPTTEPSQDPQPEPTTEPSQDPSPEPSAEPTGEPGEGEEPGEEPSPEPTEVVDPDLEPGLEPGGSEPPYEPPPTAVDVDEFGHLMAITATTGTFTGMDSAGLRTYTQPDTQVQTVYAPDGTSTTTFTADKVGTPTGTQPMDLKTVTQPDGTKVTTGYPSVPEVKTPGGMLTAPSTGVNVPLEITDGTCTSALCVSVPEPPEDMLTKNCMKGGWSWNPIDWVKTPVVCALREAFEPSPDKLDANVQRLKIALESRGFEVLIRSFDATVTDLPGGGGGCMGPPITAPMGGEEHTFYFFQACEGGMANVAQYTSYFIMLASGLFGLVAVIRNVAAGFGHTVKIAEGGESSS